MNETKITEGGMVRAILNGIRFTRRIAMELTDAELAVMKNGFSAYDAPFPSEIAASLAYYYGVGRIAQRLDRETGKEYPKIEEVFSKDPEIDAEGYDDLDLIAVKLMKRTREKGPALVPDPDREGYKKFARVSLKYARTAAGFTQEEIARLIGTTAKTVRAYEKKERPATAKYLWQFSIVTGFCVDDLEW